MRRGSSTATEKVVEKPVIIEGDCPECPDCPEETPAIHIDTLHIKSDDSHSVIINKIDKNIVVKKDWIVGDDCEIHTPQEIVKGKYAVTSLSNIAPSHLPPFFDANPKYPKECNERNYKNNENEKLKVAKYASNFNPNFLITDDITPENGAIITTQEGIVLGGNGRTMILLVVADKPEKYKSYSDLLIKKAGNFVCLNH